MLEAITQLNWKQILIGDEKWSFMLEIFLSTFFYDTTDNKVDFRL